MPHKATHGSHEPAINAAGPRSTCRCLGDRVDPRVGGSRSWGIQGGGGIQGFEIQGWGSRDWAETGQEDPGLGDSGLGGPGANGPGLGAPLLGAPGLGYQGVGDPGLGEPGLGEPGSEGAGPLTPGKISLILRCSGNFFPSPAAESINLGWGGRAPNAAKISL